jgi:phage FluMu gp28-like protein
VHDAIADGMRLDLDQLWDSAMHDSRIFDQLYMGKFLDGDLQYIPSEYINRATRDLAKIYGGQRFGGIDIGESRDRTVLVVLEGKPGELAQVVHVESHKQTDDQLLQRIISQAFGAHGCTRVGIDATGMGSFPAKAARRSHGPKLEPIQFTAKVKEDMASRLYQAFADEALILPRTLPTPGVAEAMREDIASIRRIVTSAGNVRFDAPRTSAGHADIAWALMMALHAMGGSAGRGAYAKMRRTMGEGPAPRV